MKDHGREAKVLKVLYNAGKGFTFGQWLNRTKACVLFRVFTILYGIPRAEKRSDR